LKWPPAQLFQAALARGIGNCSVYLFLISLVLINSQLAKNRSHPHPHTQREREREREKERERERAQIFKNFKLYYTLVGIKKSFY
jgi:hypothetical protein